MDIVFFVCVGIFFIYKLTSSLGVRADDELILEKTIKEFSKKENIPSVVEEQKKKEEEEKALQFEFVISDSEKAVLKKMQFDKEEFLMGVEDAVEIVSNLLSGKDFENLKNVLSEDLFKKFKEQIDDLDKQGKILKSEVIFLKDKRIKGLRANDEFVWVDAEVETEQINYLENKEKDVILGSRKAKVLVKEVWTFKRKVTTNVKDSFWIVENVA
jgi:predicted lipid-binding transport protein (Tim44 family)